MWRELRESIVARIRLAFNILIDAVFVLIWVYVAELVNEFIPSQLPDMDRGAVETYITVATYLLLFTASIHSLYDVYCLVIRLWRDAVKKWRESDEE